MSNNEINKSINILRSGVFGYEVMKMKCWNDKGWKGKKFDELFWNAENNDFFPINFKLSFVHFETKIQWVSASSQTFLHKKGIFAWMLKILIENEWSLMENAWIVCIFLPYLCISDWKIFTDLNIKLCYVQLS